MNSADLLTALELCDRKGYWSRRWEKHKLSAIEMVRLGVTEALTVPAADDFGEHAGEAVVNLAADRGLDEDKKVVNLHGSVLHHAAIADLISVFIRKPAAKPWLRIAKSKNWNPSAFLDPSGTHLRRFIPVSNWTPERAQHELRSWYVLGEVCMWRRPMQLVVAVLGPQNGGRRHNAWGKAFLHPQHSSLRFQIKNRGKIDGFKETWIRVFREEHDEIPRDRWVEAMLNDDVLREILFVIEVPVPGDLQVQRIRDMALFKLDQLSKFASLPERKLSVCDGPLSPCSFRGCCWGDPESSPTQGIFDVVDANGVAIR